MSKSSDMYELDSDDDPKIEARLYCIRCSSNFGNVVIGPLRRVEINVRDAYIHHSMTAEHQMKEQQEGR